MERVRTQRALHPLTRPQRVRLCDLAWRRPESMSLTSAASRRAERKREWDARAPPPLTSWAGSGQQRRSADRRTSRSCRPSGGARAGRQRLFGAATPLPIVASRTDCVVRGAQDVEDHSDDEEDRADAVEDAGAGDESEKNEDDSEEDHAVGFPSRVGMYARGSRS